MPFDTVQESYSMSVEDGSTVRGLMQFLASHSGPQTTVTVKDGVVDLVCVREETPGEKSIRVEKKEKSRLRNKANYLKMKEEEQIKKY